MASERFDEFMRGAVTSPNQGEAAYFAQLATAEALGRIADVLEEMWAEAKEDASGGNNVNPEANPARA